MANVRAYEDFDLTGDIFDFGTTTLTTPTAFEYENAAGTNKVHVFGSIADGFTYGLDFATGEMQPITGTAVRLNILDLPGTTQLVDILNISLPAAGNFNGAFLGQNLYPAIFGGDDEFSADDLREVSFYGDFDILDAFGAFSAGNDIFLDGKGAASSLLVGDARQLEPGPA